MRYGMLIELDRCVGCKACVSACKERWDSGPGVSRDWVKEFESGSRDTGLELTFYPGLCMHCEAHPCTADCPTGATFADGHGVVKVDAELCIGCGNCISRCPYGARIADQTKGVVEKCNFCAPYVARGERPACVDACLAECRVFGDLTDPGSAVTLRIRETGAKTLTRPGLELGPKVFFSPAEKRDRLLAHGALGESVPSNLTKAWTGATRPAAQFGVPIVAALVGGFGLLVNFRSRGQKESHEPTAKEPSNEQTPEHAAKPAGVPAKPSTENPGKAPATLKRHRFGMRFLHWFNALSWVVLLLSGTALMATPSFALFGTTMPRVVANWVGGAANLLWLHVAWGLLWAAMIVPFFLYFKRGGIEAWHEIRLTSDDFTWLLAKPRALLRLGDVKLPPQDKYNAGQKLFALSALAGTATLILTGLIMAFHLGSAPVVAAAVLVHKLAILLALVGLAVHVTMAAILVEERPALRAMVRGEIDRDHARHHSVKWVEELEKDQKVRNSAGSAERGDSANSSDSIEIDSPETTGSGSGSGSAESSGSGDADTENRT